MMPKRRVLILTANPLHNGPRYIREIEALKKDFEIHAIGGSAPHDASLAYTPITDLNSNFLDKVRNALAVRLRHTFPATPLFFMKKKLHAMIRQLDPAVVIVHNPVHLPYVCNYPGRRFKIVFNAHEYHPLEFDESPQWMKTWGKYYYNLYKNWLHKVDLLINVCDGIADKCREEFGVPSIVIPNAALYNADLKPVIRDRKPIRMIHHGIVLRGRKIERMIEATRMLGPDYSLDLMLMPGKDGYYEELQATAAAAGNVRMIDPVPFKEIVPFINQYDIGLYSLPPSNFNNSMSLPNKFFEYIQGRLCLVTGPSVEMKKIVEQYQLGKVATDFTPEALVSAIGQLSVADIAGCKKKSDEIAYTLSAEAYQELLLKHINRILN